MEIVQKKPVIDPQQIVEEREKQVCLHPRHKTMKKNVMWQCRICGEVRVKGVNSRLEEK